MSRVNALVVVLSSSGAVACVAANAPSAMTKPASASPSRSAVALPSAAPAASSAANARPAVMASNLGPSITPPNLPVGFGPSDDPPPMTASGAGGECRFGGPIVLGPSAERVHVSLGFGAKSGLVAWIDNVGMLRMRPLDRSGAPTGEATTIAFEKDDHLLEIAPLGIDFVVSMSRSERADNKVAYHHCAVLVRPDGRIAGPSSMVGAPDVWKKWPRSESRGGRFAYVGYRGKYDKAGQPATWIEIHANTDGTVVEDARPVEPAITTDSAEAGARVRGEGPMTILLPRSKTAVVQGRAIPLQNTSLARIDWTEQVLGGQWLPGGTTGLLGAPDRHLRIVWFEGDMVHAADVRGDGTTTNETTHAPLAPIPSIPDEVEVWGGGHSNEEGFSPSFPRRRVFLPGWKTVQGGTSPEERFRIPDVELDGGKLLPIESGEVAWSGTHIVYVYREGSELRVRSATCNAPGLGRRPG